MDMITKPKKDMKARGLSMIVLPAFLDGYQSLLQALFPTYKSYLVLAEILEVTLTTKRVHLWQ